MYKNRFQLWYPDDKTFRDETLEATDSLELL
jgi:hypothetical protein